MILIETSADGSSPFINEPPSVPELPVSNTIASVPLVRYGREVSSRGTHRHNQSLKHTVDMTSAKQIHPVPVLKLGC